MSEGKIERELGKEIRESEREFKFVTSQNQFNISYDSKPMLKIEFDFSSQRTDVERWRKNPFWCRSGNNVLVVQSAEAKVWDFGG